jgi:hypothetical protein
MGYENGRETEFIQFHKHASDVSSKASPPFNRGAVSCLSAITAEYAKREYSESAHSEPETLKPSNIL